MRRRRRAVEQYAENEAGPPDLCPDCAGRIEVQINENMSLMLTARQVEGVLIAAHVCECVQMWDVEFDELVAGCRKRVNQ
jgi:hypothetical protein